MCTERNAVRTAVLSYLVGASALFLVYTMSSGVTTKACMGRELLGGRRRCGRVDLHAGDPAVPQRVSHALPAARRLTLRPC